MSGFRLKLRDQGLLLLGCLVTMELVFVGSQIWLLARAEDETKKQESARLVINKADDILQSLYVAGDKMGKYAFNKDADSLAKYQTACGEVKEEIDFIRNEVKDNQSQLAQLQKLELKINEGLAMLAEVKTVSDTEPPMVTMRFAIRMRGRMQKHLEGLVADLLEFLKQERVIANRAPAVVKAENDTLKIILLAGVVLNIIAALVMARFFTTNITRKLQTVVENSDRLMARETLKAPLLGADELALLDQAFHDMSRSLRGEEELLKASREQIRALIQQMPLGLMLLNDTAQIQYANPVAEKYLGATHRGLNGSKLAEYLPGFEAAAGQDDKAFKTAIELTAVKKDGGSLPVQFSLAKSGNNSDRIALLIDLTQKKELERMRQDFVAMVSHDLRTPLTSVGGFLEFLPMGIYGAVTPLAVSKSESAREEVNQLITIISDLLDLEKLEAGKVELTKKMIDLEDIIDEVVDDSVEQADKYGVGIMFDGCTISMPADREGLKRAVAKLLQSLLRLAPAGDTIAIQAKSSTDKVTISFVCPQLKLPAAVLPYIYEPFQQIDLPDGTVSPGLGLALAKALIVQLGGSTGAQAQPVASLWLTLPLI